MVLSLAAGYKKKKSQSLAQGESASSHQQPTTEKQGLSQSASSNQQPFR
jgi:hypothetical protein